MFASQGVGVGRAGGGVPAPARIWSRVHQDLQRFKELIETRVSETGAWRGDISEGSTKGGERA
jgi:hypothetical protein